MKHFPEKLGFVFAEGTQTFEGEEGEDEVESRTPFQLACEEFNKEEITKIVLEFVDGCLAVADIRTESSFLLEVAADESIHLDGLYILLRKDPAALLRLLQKTETGNTDRNVAGSSTLGGIATEPNSDAGIGVQSFKKNRKRRRTIG